MRDAEDADLGNAECALAVQAAIRLPILSREAFRVGGAGRSVDPTIELRSGLGCRSRESNGLCGTGGGVGGSTESRSETNTAWFLRGGNVGGTEGTAGSGSSLTLGDFDLDRSAARPDPLAFRSH